MSTESTLLTELAKRHEMDVPQLVSVVKQRCFKDGAASDAQLMLLLTIAKKYDLNPLAREVHAFINKGRLEVTIGLDGWIKIATRHVMFNGYETTPILNDHGVLTAITVKMHRKDWAVPGEYTAWMDEWMVAGKQGEKSNWEQYPRHRLFAKAFQECARFTFGITEVIDEDDAERIAAAKVIEASPVVPEPTPAELTDKCQHTGCVENAIGKFKTKAGEFYLCQAHRAQHEVKRRGRPPRATDGAEMAAGTEAAEEERQSGGGEQGEPTAPSDTPQGSGPAPAPAAAEAQRAAGLEKIDPDELPLETFIRVHDVPAKRVNLALAKYGATSLAELTAEQQAAILGVLERSYANAAH